MLATPTASSAVCPPSRTPITALGIPYATSSSESRARSRATSSRPATAALLRREADRVGGVGLAVLGGGERSEVGLEEVADGLDGVVDDHVDHPGPVGARDSQHPAGAAG